MVDGFCLMAPKAVDSDAFPKCGWQRSIEFARASRPRGEPFDVNETTVGVESLDQRVDGFVERTVEGFVESAVSLRRFIESRRHCAATLGVVPLGWMVCGR